MLLIPLNGVCKFCCYVHNCYKISSPVLLLLNKCTILCYVHDWRLYQLVMSMWLLSLEGSSLLIGLNPLLYAKWCDVVGLIFRSDLKAVLSSLYDTIFSQDGTRQCSSSHQDTMEVFLSAATLSKEVEGTESSMSLADFKNWCRVLPSVRKFLGSLLMPPDSGKVTPDAHVSIYCTWQFPGIVSSKMFLRCKHFIHLTCIAWLPSFSLGIGNDIFSLASFAC